MVFSKYKTGGFWLTFWPSTAHGYADTDMRIRIRGYGYADTDIWMRLRGYGYADSEYGYADTDMRIRISGYGYADTDTRILHNLLHTSKINIQVNKIRM